MIQGDVALGKEVVPGVERKRRVGRSEPCDEVVLPGLDSTLSRITTMEMSGYALKIDLIFGESPFYVARTLVI